MIAECKRIRTRKGDPMMFATLDDLEGQVEMLVFNSAYAKNAEKVDVDRIVIVRGRVDHKEQGEVKLVAQEVEVFEPTPRGGRARGGRGARRAGGQAASRCTCSPGVPDSFLEELRGDRRAPPRATTSCCSRSAQRRLLLGRDFRVSADSACRSELGGLTGAARIVA